MAVAGVDEKSDDRIRGANRRRWSRYRLAEGMPARLVTEAGDVACLIDDISLAGARLRLPPDHRLNLERGSPLRLAPVGGPSLAGTAAWSGDGALGVALDYSDASVALTFACLALPAER